MNDKEFIEKVLNLDSAHTYPEYLEHDLGELCDQYRKEKEDWNNRVKYNNACGTCKHFKDAIPRNKVWFTCQHSPYKMNSNGHKAGDLRLCHVSMNKCCYYEKCD